MIASGVPYRRVVVPRCFSILIIQHGVQRHLERDAYAALILFIQAQRGGQPAARAFAAYHDLIAANAQFPRMLFQINQRVMAIQQRRRVGSLNGQPIVGRYHHRAVLFDQVFGSRYIDHARHAGDIAAAVNPQYAGTAGCITGHIWAKNEQLHRMTIR